MNGIPIKDFDKLLSRLDTINQTWLAIYDLLKPSDIVGDTKMPIPLQVKLLFGTGSNLGTDTPLPIFQEMGSQWQDILTSTVESNQAVTGYKVAKLESYQPGDTHTFNVVVDPSFSEFKPGKVRPIEIFLIDSNLALGAAISVVASVASEGFFGIDQYIPKFIAYMKHNGWIQNLLPAGGSFNVTPGNSQCLLHFCIHTLNDGGQGAVITNFDATTNTFTIGGY
jgi:hypothetical protein